MSKRAHGEGTIRKRADGRWEAMITVPQPDGSTKRRSIYGKTQAEVRRKLTEARGTLDKGDELIANRQTVAQFLDRWLADAARPTLRPSTLVSYQSKIALYILPSLGKHRLTALTPQHIQAMMTAMADRGLSPRSVEYTRAILRRALNQALRWGLVSRNVAALTNPPRVVKQEIQALTQAQARRFLDIVKGDRLEALYAVALSLGLRQGEALGLRWEDVDLDAGEMRVRRTLVKLNGQPFRLSEPKTRQSRRNLPLTPALIAQLRVHRVRQLEERLLVGDKWEGEAWGLVFTTPTGGPFSLHTLIPQFKEAPTARRTPRDALPRPTPLLRLSPARPGCSSPRSDGNPRSQHDYPDDEHLQPRTPPGAA
ncbi:MAG: tyrosine-type recombinase/integrase [Chloroflexia bacterium]